MTRKKDNKRTLPGKRRSAMVFEELEPRLLLSADLPIDLPAVLAPDRGDDEPVAVHEEITTTAVTGEQHTTHELVFVDTDTPDYQLLQDDLLNSSETRQFEVILLDNSSDGIAQITTALSEYRDLDAVHIISHGSEGSIDLGGTQLEFDTLLANTTSIQGWAEAFSEQGDILIYGCNLAASADGQALVASLARLTGADVAASDDLTGSVEQGGDWELEYQTGRIDTSVAVSTELRRDWTGTLDTAQVSAEYISTPLAFEQNTGQTDEAVDYLSRGDGYSVFLSDGDAVLVLNDSDSQHAIRLDLVGANTDLNVVGQDELGSSSNYLIGNDESNWQTNIDNFASVYYENVYEGIDLRYYGNQRQLEYDFVVGPGSDPDEIRLSFDGVLNAEITESGELRLVLNEQGDETLFKAPISYQTADDGSRIAVESAYVIYDDGSIGFTLGDYDSSRELVIDPILDYLTFIGGTGYEVGNAIAVDDSGNVYITGYTASTDFPTTVGALSETHAADAGSYDIYVAKLSADGSSLVYSTFIGGDGLDYGYDIKVDGSGNAYVTGLTYSTDLATVNAFQSSLSGTTDAYLLKLNSTGDTLLYSSYFGGSAANELAQEVVLDSSGMVYITGWTQSADLPLKNALDSSLGGTQDAFVARFDLTQTGSNSLLYSTYFGGSGTDSATGLDVDSAGNFYISGYTQSNDLTTVNAYDSTFNGVEDIFLTKFNSTGSALLYSSYLGGADSEYGDGLAVDDSGNAYLAGRARTGFSTTAGAYDTSHGGGTYDTVVAKFDTTLTGASSLSYSTYLGGGGWDMAYGLDIDADGNVYVTGATSSLNHPTTADGNDRILGGSFDGYLTVLDANGASLVYSTYLGGGVNNRGYDVTLDSDGTAYVTGFSESNETWGSTSPTTLGPGGGTDAFVAKFIFNQAPTATSNTYTVAEGATLNGNVISDNTGAGVDSDPEADPLTASVVDGPLHGTLVLNADGSFTYTPYDAPTDNFADSDSFTYQVSDGKGGSDTATVNITVTPDASNEAPINSVPSTQTTGQDLPLVFSQTDGNQILVRDDAGGNAVEVTLTATNGTVILSTTSGLSIIGGADGSATVTVQGTLTDINKSLDGLTFTPTASYLGAASLQIDTDDLGNAPAAAPQFDSDLINIDVIAINDPPVNTVPVAQTIDQDGMLLFSSTIGTAISVADPDAGGSAIQITLTATNGTLNLQSTQGLSFSVGDGTSDTTMTFTGTIADINAALEGATFVATAGFTGTANVQIITDDLGNTGTGGAQSDTDSVSITVSPSYQSLLLTTTGSATSDAGSGSVSWNAGDLVELGDPGLTLEPVNGTTSGTFSSLPLFSLDAFAGRATNLNGIHYVTSDIVVGSNSLQLQANDILFVTDSSETLTNSDLSTLAVTTKDIVAFRPTTPGDYSSGDFFIVVRGADIGLNNITAFSLVEQDTVVGVGAGSTTLTAGEFVIVHDGAKKTLQQLTPGALGGAATNTGTTSLLVDGAAINIGQDVYGLELIESDTTLGGVDLQAGLILVTLKGDDNTVGDNSVATVRQDIFLLDITQTGATTVGDATLLFEGNDVGLDAGNNNEDVWGIGMAPNQAPTINGDTLVLDENSANGTVVGTVTATDPEGGALKYAITGGNSSGAFAINANNGQIMVANSTALDFETTPTFNLSVVAIDDDGAYSTATITINLNDLVENTTPTTSGISNVTVDEDAPNTVIDLFAAFADTEDLDSALTYTIENNTNPSLFTSTSIDGGAGTLSLDYAQNQNGSSDITVRATDTGGLLIETTFTVTVNPINDDPTNAGTLPSDLVFVEDTQGKLNLSAIDLSDVDAGSGNLTLTITSNNGHLQTLGWPGVTLGGSQSVLILTGNLTDLNDFLNDVNSIDYEHATPNISGDNVDLITVEITDNGNTGAGGGGTITLGTVNIDVTALNDAPSASNNTVTTTENTSYAFTAADFNFSDIDGDTLASIKITSLEAVGSLQLSGVDVTLNQVISRADIDAGNLTFVPVANANGAGYDGFSFSVNDGTVDSATSYTMTIDVNAVNQAPTLDLNGIDGGGTDFATTFTEDGSAVNVTDTDAIVSDVDDILFQGLGINLFGMSDGANEQIVVAGYTFTYGTSDVVTRTVGSTDFELDFDGTGFSIVKDAGGNMPLADLQLLMRGVTYENTSQNPTTGNRTLDFSVQDASGLSSPTATSTITVNAQNDAPVVTTTAGSTAYTEQAAATIIDAGLTLVDPDGFDGTDPSDQFVGLVRITGNYEAADMLGFTDTAKIQGVLSGDQLVLSVIGGQTATVAEFEAAMQSVTFYSGSDEPSELNRTITFSFDDGVDSSNVATKTLTLTAINDDPTNNGTLPSDVTVLEGVSTGVDLSAVDFGDLDHNNQLLTVTLTTSTGGRLYASTDIDVIVAGSSTGFMTLTGGVASLNTFFDSATRIQYLHGTANTAGDNADTIQVQIRDNGNTGSGGGGNINLGTVNVDITNVNDAPSGTDKTVTTNEDTDYIFTISDFGFSDASDSPADSLANILISSAPANGTLYVDANDDGIVDGGEALVATDTVAAADIIAGRLKFKPVADANGVGYDSFTFQVKDDGGTANSGADTDPTVNTITIDVTAVNDAPIATADSFTVNEGSTTNLNLATNDTDADGGLDLTSITIVSGPTNGSLVVNANGTVDYTHDGSETVADSFTYTIDDLATATSNTVTVSLTVTPVNDAPVAVADSFTVNESSTTNLNLATNDSDADDGLDLTSIAIVSGPTNGSIVVNANGTVDYTHDGSETLSDSFTYTIDDLTGATSNTVTVNLTVTPVNDAPIATADSFTVNEGSTTNLNLATNDTDADDGLDLTSITIVSGPSNGSLVVNADGTVDYTHDGSETVADSFTYTIDDLTAATSNTVTVSLTITPVNDAPVAVADSFTVNEGSTTNLNLATNDTDADDGLDLTSITIVSGPTNGSLVVNVDGTVDYTHDGSETVADSFTYTIDDVAGATSNTVTVNLTVTPVNDAPIATADSFTVNEGSTTNLNLAANDTDADDGLDLTSITIVSGPSNGSIVVNADGTVDYTHDGSETVADSFAYTIDDLSGATSNTVTVSLTVTPVNDAPTATADSFTVNEGSTTNLNLAANDADADDGLDLASITIVSGPTNGSIVVNANGTVDYTHGGSETVADSFTYTIDDLATATSNTVTVSLTVTPVNDAPIATADSFTVNEGSTTNLNLAANDTDTDDGLDLASITIVSGPTNGSIVVNANGAVDYTHDGSETVADSFTYTIDDLTGATSNTVTVNLTVTPVNDAPVAAADNFTVNEGSTTNLNLATNDTDADDGLDLASITIVSGPSNGSIVVNADGSVDYTHDGSETVADSFTYTIDDLAGSTSNTVTVSLTITPVNDAPTAVADSFTVNEGSTANLNLAGNDTDADDGLDLNSITIVSGPTNGSLVVNADGTVDYTHDGSETVADSFTYTIDDLAGVTSNTVTVNLAVTPVNDAPVAVSDSFTVNEGSTTNLNLAGNDTDADDGLDLTSITIVSGPANGSLVVNADGTVDYTHDGSETVADSFTYTIDDVAGATSNTVTVNLTVTPVNDAPIATADSFTMNEGSTTNLNLATNDTDADDGLDLSSITIVSGPSNGSLVVNADGTVDYTHDGSETVADSFTYTIDDLATATSNTVTVSLTVTPVNDAPIATADSFTVNEGSTTNLNLAANDTDADDGLDLASITIVSGPTNGSIVVNVDGTVDYAHDGSETVADSFTL